MLKVKLTRFLVPLACSLASLSATAWEQYATVKGVEATYLPSAVGFQVTAPPAECPGQIMWTPLGATDAAKVENAKAVTAVLLTALSSGQPLYVYGTGCVATQIYLMQ